MSEEAQGIDAYLEDDISDNGLGPEGPRFAIAVLGPNGIVYEDDLLQWAAELRDVSMVLPATLELATTGCVCTFEACEYGDAVA